MKKQIKLMALIAVGLLSQFLLPAQGIRFGLKAGGGVARLAYSNPDAVLPTLYPHSGLFYTEKGGFKPAFTVGGVMEYDLSKDFFVSTGLTVCSRSYETMADTVEMYAYLADTKASLFYLQMPLVLHYRAGRFFLGAGAYGGMGVAGKWKNVFNDQFNQGSTTSGKTKFGSDPEKDNLRRFDAGLHLELGYGLKQVRLTVAYDHGLTDGLKNYVDPNESEYRGSLRQRAIKATVSYFWLAK